MTNEERNNKMEYLFPREDDQRVLIIVANSPEMEAIRECDRKARAWDELEEWVKTASTSKYISSTYSDFWKDIVGKMYSLLAPDKPKSKLDQLRDVVRLWPKSIPVEDMLEAIDEIDARDD